MTVHSRGYLPQEEHWLQVPEFFHMPERTDTQFQSHSLDSYSEYVLNALVWSFTSPCPSVFSGSRSPSYSQWRKLLPSFPQPIGTAEILGPWPGLTPPMPQMFRLGQSQINQDFLFLNFLRLTLAYSPRQWHSFFLLQK